MALAEDHIGRRPVGSLGRQDVAQRGLRRRLLTQSGTEQAIFEPNFTLGANAMFTMAASARRVGHNGSAADGSS